jgi:virulence-associated protein VagC
MKTKLFKSGGSWAVRIPKDWVPRSGSVDITKEGNRIVVTESSDALRALALSFAEDGWIEFERPEQPVTPDARFLP